MTINLPDERELRAAAKKAGKSFPAYLAELASRKKKAAGRGPSGPPSAAGTATSRSHRSSSPKSARRWTPIGPNDLMIASSALAHDLVLVTRNDREFSRVPGLRLERW
ncbi:MAG: type II toxin-antitoxin system VapC family toxin [Myxococcota bacterium]